MAVHSREQPKARYQKYGMDGAGEGKGWAWPTPSNFQKPHYIF